MTASFLAVLAGSLAALDAIYLAVLAAGSLLRRESRAPSGPALASQLTVLVPAHNERDFVAGCVRSLLHQTYPRHLYRVLVIADNCSDDTAAIARSEGAEVIVRDSPRARGKGQALTWAISSMLADPQAPDAFVVVDADSTAEPRLLEGLARRYEAGADAVQGEYLALEGDGSKVAELRRAAFLLFNRVRPDGRAALGLPCSLMGDGMLLSRQLLERVPWRAFGAVEDLEYSVQLRLAGVAPVFASGAVVRGPLADSARAAKTQRRRWLGGRLHVVRGKLPTLLVQAFRRHDLSLLDSALDLATPPLGLLGSVVLAGTATLTALVVAGLSPSWVLLPWVLAAIAIAFFVLVGLRAARAPASTYLALLCAPLFVGAELLDSLRLPGGRHATNWIRTERPSDRPGGEPPRPVIKGVPIDPVDMKEALQRVMAAVAAREFVQVCTVNLDFMVNARRDDSVRTILEDGQLNLADGKPVVWLGRLLGTPIPGRLAGADFVLALMESAAASGARVFLLGGENGTAEVAARRLAERYPALQIAGYYEPPRSTDGDFDDETILRRLGETRADILLVALGHPKQEKWIHRQRHHLPASVAIGVGCTFELIARRRPRAPIWMRRAGLEWLYRLVHEPIRLFPRYATDACWLFAVFLPAVLWQRTLGRQL